MGSLWTSVCASSVHVNSQLPFQCAVFRRSKIDISLTILQCPAGFSHLEVSSEEQADLGQENLEVSPVSSRGPLNKSGASSLATVSVRWTGLRSRTPPHVLKKSSEHRRLLLPSGNKDFEVTQTVPILPWLNGEGGTNCMILQALSRRVTGIVMLNPGVTEVSLQPSLQCSYLTSTECYYLHMNLLI